MAQAKTQNKFLNRHPGESRDLIKPVQEDPVLQRDDGCCLLDRVHIPADMRGFTDAQLKQLADELRRETIQVVSKTGGHLGAGLGVVELTIAIHAVFDTPNDKLIWDVGHQTYPHKILTGRRDRIHTLRQGGGLSGFTKRSESEYDPFGAAHSSTSISAGLGMAVARDLTRKRHPETLALLRHPETPSLLRHPETLALKDLDSSGQALQNDNSFDRHIIVVIGDGAMSAGMAYEAMNNAGALKSRLIVILNDNEMSIAPPVGAMSRYLTKLVSSKPYITAREFGKRLTEILPPPLRHAAKRAEESARTAMGHGTFFEEMGFYYIGPVDGHNLDHLLPILRNLRDGSHEGPVLIHAITQKGKGYLPAENSSDKMHGVKKFDVITGDQVKGKIGAPTYTKVFAQALIAEARRDPKIIGITAAMPDGTGMDLFAHEFPDRMFDVGIAEQHGVTFAAGLAAGGFKPFVAIYSTFLQRGYDQVVHDVALQNLPVRFAIDRAGLVGADGQTHAGAFDIAYLGCLPNFVLMAASDEAELVNMVATAAAYNDGPIAFRYPRGEGTGAALPESGTPLEIGKGRIVYTSPLSPLSSPPSSLSSPRKRGSNDAPETDPRLRGERRERSIAILSYDSPSPSLRGGGADEAIHPSTGTELDCRVADAPRNDSIAILSYGTRLEECLKAVKLLEEKGKTVTVADARFAKPLDESLITQLAQNHAQLITIEEGARGGFGSFVLEFMNDAGLLANCRVKTLHLPDIFQDHDDPAKQYETAGLTARDIVKLIK